MWSGSVRLECRAEASWETCPWALSPAPEFCATSDLWYGSEGHSKFSFCDKWLPRENHLMMLVMEVNVVSLGENIDGLWTISELRYSRSPKVYLVNVKGLLYLHSSKDSIKFPNEVRDL